MNKGQKKEQLINNLILQAMENRIFSGASGAILAIKKVMAAIEKANKVEEKVNGFLLLEQTIFELKLNNTQNEFLFSIPRKMLETNIINNNNNILFELSWLASREKEETNKLPLLTKKQIENNIYNAIHELQGIKVDKRLFLLMKLYEQFKHVSGQETASNEFVALIPFILSDEAKRLGETENNAETIEKKEIRL